MRQFQSIEAFLVHLATLPAVLHEAQPHGEKAAGEDLVKTCQAMIGTEREEWPPLAESTVAEKQRLGYTGRVSATDPLYRTGELRISISYRIEQGSLLLGSTDPVAPFHEFGTMRIPERSFIGATMFTEGRKAADHVAEHILAALAGSPAPHRKG